MRILKHTDHVFLQGENSIASGARESWTDIPLDKQGIVLEIWSSLSHQVQLFSSSANCFCWQFSKESTGRVLQNEIGHSVIKSGVKSFWCTIGRRSEQLVTSWAVNGAWIPNTQACFLTKHNVTGDFLSAFSSVPTLLCFFEKKKKYYPFFIFPWLH